VNNLFNELNCLSNLSTILTVLLILHKFYLLVKCLNKFKNLPIQNFDYAMNNLPIGNEFFVNNYKQLYHAKFNMVK